MDCTTETPRRRPGPKPRQIECRGERLTIEEWANKTGLEPGTIRYRLYQLNWPASLALALPLGTHASRAGVIKDEQLHAVKDVTDEPKRKPADPVDPAKDRDEVVGGLLKRLREPGSYETPETALVAAYNAGVAAGRNAR